MCAVRLCCAEVTVPNVLSILCSNDMTPSRHLESQQALFHQFAKIIDFTLKFDDLKVCPHSQFDWLYRISDKLFDSLAFVII